MKTIQIDNNTYEVPGGWNEMTFNQLLFLASLFSQERTAQEVKLQLLLYTLNARINRYKRADGDGYRLTVGKKTYYLLPNVFAGLSEAFDFLFKENEDGHACLDIRLTKNPFPVIALKDTELHGPDDGLSNLSYGQFVMLRTWQARMSVNIEDSLDNFIAIMYKENAFNTDEEGNPALLKEVHQEVKLVIYWFYLGCMSFIQERFPRVFPGGSESRGDVFDGQMRLIDEMAGGDVTKKEQVKKSLLFDAIYTLDMAIERDAKAKKKS